MQMQVATSQPGSLEALASGNYGLKRQKLIMPDQFSDIVSRHLRAVESQQSPSGKLWLHYSYEIQALREARAELLRSYGRLGRWQGITIGLLLILEAAHGVIALIVTTNIVILAPVGGSAFVFGGAFTCILRYLTKEKATAMRSFARMTKSLADCQSVADHRIISERVRVR